MTQRQKRGDVRLELHSNLSPGRQSVTTVATKRKNNNEEKKCRCTPRNKDVNTNGSEHSMEYCHLVRIVMGGEWMRIGWDPSSQ